VRGHLDTPGVTEFRADVGPAFSREFSDWIPRLLAENAAAADRPARLQPAAAGRPGLSPAAGGLE
jgi:hypothetical protein